MFTTADVERYKPAPEPYLHAAAELGLDPQQVTLVAAHGWDVIGAINAELQAVWATGTSGNGRSRCRNHGARRISCTRLS